VNVALYNQAVANPTIPLATVPTAVTIFPDRARVTRAGRAKVSVGPQRLEVGSLPLALVADSVRATGRGTARAKLMGVTTRLEQFVETPAEAALALEKQIQDLEDGDVDLAVRGRVVEKEQTYLDGLAAQSEMFARGLALRNRSPEEQGAIFDFISARSRALQAELLAIIRDRRDRAKELDRLRRQLRAWQSARPKQRYVAVVELEVATEGELDLELAYVVLGAAWQPLYDFRLADGSVELAYLAQVAQNTGEDWPNVVLTLSTARPSITLAIPELDPWYIHPRPPTATAPMRAAKMMAPQAIERAVAGADVMESRPVGAAASAREELAIDSAAVSESGASLTYQLAGQADVPGNNEPRKVTIAVVNLKPELTYVTAPKLEPVCYRRAEIKNDSPYSLLPGAAQLFEGDEYLGATRLEFVAPGQVFELALGADERMRVERELVARDVDKAFIIGDRRRIRYGFTIEVENLRDAVQQVAVRDQIPVARDEQIKVRLDSADPKPSEQTELNQLEWKLTLDKGAKRTIRFDYSVEYPRSMDVVGLL
jgi:uncharacterized protein (TIGR02231 family)